MASTAALLPAPDVTKHICDLIHEQLREHAPVSVLCLGFDVLGPIYTGLLCRFAGRYLDAAEADDLVGEAWLRALVNIARFDCSKPVGLRNWLCTLLRNRALNMIRAKKRHPVQTGRDRELAAVIDRSRGPWDELEANWERERAASVVTILRKKLPPDERRLLELCCMEERPARDVARELGLKPAQVRYRKYRLLKKVRKMLGVVYGEKAQTGK